MKKNNFMIKLIVVLLLFTAYSRANPPGKQRFRQGEGHRHGQNHGRNAAASHIPAELMLQDINGKNWNGEILQGKIVIMEFWAPWCAPCLQQIPHLRQIHETYRDQGVVMLGVNVDNSDRRTKRRWLQRNSGKMGWPQLVNRNGLNGDLPRRFGISQIPDILVFNSAGELASRGPSSRGLEQVIESLLKKDNEPQKQKSLISTD